MNRLLVLAAKIAVGKRPAGGPYQVAVSDGDRSRTSEEYRIRVELHGTDSDESEWREKWTMRTEDWRALLRQALA